MTVIAAARLLGSDVPSDGPAWMEVHDDRVIVATGAGTRAGADDLGDAIVVPGYLDIQVNGFGAIDFATASTDDARSLLDALRVTGVTGCCPTIVSAPLDAYEPALARLAPLATHPSMLGVHLEGPFLGGAPGAHTVELLRAVDVDWLAHLLDSFPGLVRIVTLAPEADPGFVATRFLASRGVVVALGHSIASYDVVRDAASAGATLVTHLYNGMGPLHHRSPGMPGAALDDTRLTPSLIGDLLHVHPALVRLTFKVRPDVAVVTDAVAVDGVHVLERGGAAYLPDGTLAGSTLTMERAVQNLGAAGISLERAIDAVTRNPARVAHVKSRGRLVAGARADYVVLDPATLAVRAVHQARPGRPAPPGS